MRGPTASNTGSAARVDGLEALAAGEPGVERLDARAPAARPCARAQQASASRLVQQCRSDRSVRAPLRSGVDHAHVGQAEVGGERVAIAERLVEMLAGVEEDHRQVAVDLRRPCAAAPPNPRRSDDTAAISPGNSSRDRPLDDLERPSDGRRARRAPPPRRRCRPRRSPIMVKRPWLRSHRAPP